RIFLFIVLVTTLISMIASIPTQEVAKEQIKEASIVLLDEVRLHYPEYFTAEEMEDLQREIIEFALLHKSPQTDASKEWRLLLAGSTRFSRLSLKIGVLMGRIVGDLLVLKEAGSRSLIDQV
ncbi:hypothetical protein PFISCL1PPCAC_19042, partial [Pristionchus fissidentatus]